MQKQLLAINDISCMGRCSLTVALPIISSAGISTAIMPTAVLSTHTGGFSGYTFLDFTEEMDKICKHWETLHPCFDCIYTGFLGSIKQVEVVSSIVERLKKENTIIYVDPAMADNGKMYAIFDMTFANEMKKLCAKADVLCPNVTEACFLTDTPYQEAPYSKDFIDLLVKKLGKFNLKAVILTGVSFDSKTIGAYSYSYETGKSDFYAKEVIPGYFHGTGDCFASAFIGAYIKGKDLFASSKIAVDFTVNSIKETIKYPNIDIKYGVCFEEALPSFVDELR